MKLFILFCIIVCTSCTDINTPNEPIITNNILNTDSIRQDSSIYNDYVYIQFVFKYIPNQLEYRRPAKAYPIITRINNVTQDSINKICNNYYNDSSYTHYHQIDILNYSLRNNQYVHDTAIYECYNSKPFNIKLPKTDSIPRNYDLQCIITNGHLELDNNRIYSTMIIRTKFTLPEIECINKKLNVDTVLKFDTLIIPIKIIPSYIQQ